jgi:hypothetical protein
LIDGLISNAIILGGLSREVFRKLAPNWHL